jgi:hypothetical protein
LVYGELLIGDLRGRGELLKPYGLMHRLSPVPHPEVIEFVRAHKLYGRVIGWLNAHLLAPAVVANVPLWTADERFARLASGVGAGYLPSAT